MNLKDLIFDATTQLGSDACRVGKHLWESLGSRGCPHKENTGSCGQAVYRCSVCGAYDYGEPGGPGAADCAATSRCEFRDVLPNIGHEAGARSEHAIPFD